MLEHKMATGNSSNMALRLKCIPGGDPEIQRATEGHRTPSIRPAPAGKSRSHFLHEAHGSQQIQRASQPAPKAKLRSLKELTQQRSATKHTGAGTSRQTRPHQDHNYEMTVADSRSIPAGTPFPAASIISQSWTWRSRAGWEAPAPVCFCSQAVWWIPMPVPWQGLCGVLAPWLQN